MIALQQKTTEVLFLIACMAFANVCYSANANEIKHLNMLYAKKDTWQKTILASRQKCKILQVPQKEKKKLQQQLWRQIEKDFPVEWDWTIQDYGIGFYKWFNNDADVIIEQELTRKVLDELVSAVAGEDEPEFTRHMGIANRRLIAGENVDEYSRS